MQVSRLKREISSEQLQTLYSACAGLPALVATGAQDGIVPRAQVQIPCIPADYALQCCCVAFSGVWEECQVALASHFCVAAGWGGGCRPWCRADARKRCRAHGVYTSLRPPES